MRHDEVSRMASEEEAQLTMYCKRGLYCNQPLVSDQNAWHEFQRILLCS